MNEFRSGSEAASGAEKEGVGGEVQLAGGGGVQGEVSCDEKERLEAREKQERERRGKRKRREDDIPPSATSFSSLPPAVVVLLIDTTDAASPLSRELNPDADAELGLLLKIELTAETGVLRDEVREERGPGRGMAERERRCGCCQGIEVLSAEAGDSQEEQRGRAGGRDAGKEGGEAREKEEKPAPADRSLPDHSLPRSSPRA